MNLANRNLFNILLTTTVAIFIWTSFLSTAKAQNAMSPVQQQPVESTAVLPPEVKTAVLNDVLQRTSRTVSTLKIIEARSRSWSDGCLGLAKPEEMCSQAVVSGWQVTVTDGLKNWLYRTDESGKTVRLEKQ